MPNRYLPTLLSILLLFALTAGWGVITDYTFSGTTGNAYAELTEGTTHGTSANDNEVFNNIPLGFDFNYNGTVYSNVSIATNGFIAMGAAVTTSNSAISSGTTNNVAVGFNRDLKSRDTGSLMSFSSGTAPNRVFTIQWKNYKRTPTAAANDTINFQIKLFEGTNAITFNYGYFNVATVSTAATVQVGLRGDANTEYTNRTTTTDWTATTPGTANNSNCTINATVFPPNGLIFAWTPPQAGTPPNPAQIVSPADGAANIALYANLNWLSGGGAPTGYKVFLGTDNPPTNLVNGILQTAATYNPENDFTHTTTYYWQIVPNNEFGDAVGCPVWSFSTIPDPTVAVFPYAQNWDGVTAPAVPPTWTVINDNNDSFTWVTVTTSANSAPNALRCSYNPSTGVDMDDWVISPPLQLAAGPFYKVQFYYKAQSSSFPEKLEIRYGTANTVAGLTTQIFQDINITHTDYVMAEAYIPPTTGGIHYLGFHGFSNANMYNLYLDDITISELVPLFNPPRNLSAVFGGSSITLTWQAPETSVPVGYRVYRDGTLITGSNVTSLTYTDLTAGAGIHSYHVTAIYTNPGGESVPSNSVSGEMLTPVTNLLFNVVGHDVTLTWTAPAGWAPASPQAARNPERPLTGYKVWRDGEMIAQITDPANLTYTDTGLPNGSYIYEVTAVYTTGESAPCPFVIATVFVPIVPTYFSDGFESYPNFALDFGMWITADIDNSATIDYPEMTFPHEGEPMAFVIFTPGATTPPLTDAQAHGGLKMAACPAAVTGPNNDWLITPTLHLGTENSFSFWAMSTADGGPLERFRVGITTAANPTPESFVILSGPSYVEPPMQWTQYTYLMPTSYDNEYVRLGIKCESSGGNALLIDDVKMQGYNGTGSGETVQPASTTALLGNHPNPFHAETRIAYEVKDDGPVSISIYNLKGQKIKTLVEGKAKSGRHQAAWNGTDDNGKPVSGGVYICKMRAGDYSSTRKMILMK